MKMNNNKLLLKIKNNGFLFWAIVSVVSLQLMANIFLFAYIRHTRAGVGINVYMFFLQFIIPVVTLIVFYNIFRRIVSLIK